MKGAIKFIGTNKATSELQDKVFMDVDLQKVPHVSGQHTLTLDGKPHILTNHNCSFRENHFFVAGILTDGDSFVGRVSFLFFPKKSLTLEQITSILLS